jgi:hypothetical protein
MDASLHEQELSDTEEKLHWQAVEREALAFCDPLSRMVGRKDLIYRVGVSEGQLSRELSPEYDNRLSLSVALYILRHSQDVRLARIIFCDGAGYQLPDPQKRRVTPDEELRALKEECRAAGVAGQAILEGAAKRARSGR